MATTPIALVTGAAHGIGQACAAVLHRQGMDVVLADIDTDAATAAAQALGDRARSVTCDMADPEQIAALFKDIDAQDGTLVALVNNAGMVRPADFLDMTLEDFRTVLDVNLVGAFLATQHAGRMMVRDGVRGAIVNMTSINAQVAIPTIASYCVSKGGMAQLTKAAALALAPHGIRVNAVGPGSIDTAMVASVNADPAAMAKVMSRTPLGRLGRAEDVAETVAFLVGEGAAYITGETIYVDGGRLALNYTC
ncbi:dehydrogenase [Meridianimarinicoccus roseus]|uniref:Dehydrogenase n=1 Tax=Meridianimarinicoccus roseus TaxID=2072018 RepID=A0A2V2LBB1_9RHOB|nr:SDR family oxidoreductase [Meridianimarinicoccus roseus]PWR02688.1 dehydrogenase [Meridianimarinicoccus roseus]